MQTRDFSRVSVKKASAVGEVKPKDGSMLRDESFAAGNCIIVHHSIQQRPKVIDFEVSVEVAIVAEDIEVIKLLQNEICLEILSAKSRWLSPVILRTFFLKQEK